MGSMSGSADRPLWVPVQEMVLPGSIGAELIVKIPGLGKRLRPETTFGQPFTLPAFINGYPDLLTFGDILRLPAEELATFPSKYGLPGRLNNYFNGLVIFPHSRFLQAIYGGPQFPAPADREQEIVKGVEGVLDQIRHQNAVPIFALRFGLYDGITRSLEETGRCLKPPVTKQRVGAILVAGFRDLRRLDEFYRMRGYFVLPEASFGREIFGASLIKDLPELNGRENMRVLGLPADIVNELAGLYGFYLLTIEDLVMADLSKRENAYVAGPGVKDEIASALQRRRAEIAGRPEGKAEQSALDAAQRLAKIGEPKNNFVPEIRLSPEQLRELDETSLAAVKLSARVYHVLRRGGVRTVGELLRINRGELQDIQGIGVKTETEVVEGLTAFLKSQ